MKYALYVSHFGQSSFKLIQKTINGLYKTKYHLEKTTPNCIINSPISLNIINIKYKYQSTINKLLQWHQLKTRTITSQRGPISGWFKLLMNTKQIQGTSPYKSNLNAKF